ncbi:hypothetical protein OE88DRAFT_1656591 [Heliocybe sulcata]|uniref:Uncharacterized protein n=1 Tax=Heliocybe sulcata TaxID=5364 RepID=A0A5C3N681_9AGAM|nr:hypothetical protein OE88DRAFT_1656591 [Heliocybe sulcata]
MLLPSHRLSRTHFDLNDQGSTPTGQRVFMVRQPLLLTTRGVCTSSGIGDIIDQVVCRICFWAGFYAYNRPLVRVPAISVAVTTVRNGVVLILRAGECVWSLLTPHLV